MNEASNKQPGVVALWAKQWGLDVYRYCRKLLTSDSEAEDAMQVVFLQAVQDFEQFRDPGSELHWLLSIARHRCLDRLKMLRRRPPSAEEEEGMDVPSDGRGADGALEDSEVAREVAKCLDELPAHTRTAIVLRYHEQLSYESIEALTGTKAGALRVRVLRGLVQLKECLEERGVSW